MAKFAKPVRAGLRSSHAPAGKPARTIDSKGLALLALGSARIGRTPAALALAVALALGPAAAARAASPLKGGAYIGSTAQDETLSFLVADDGRTVLELSTTLTYRCTGEHDGQAGSFVLADVRIKRGRFTTRQDLKGTTASSVVSGGVGRMKGVFKRKGNRAKGSLRSTLTLTGGETCDSGRVRFSADVL